MNHIITHKSGRMTMNTEHHNLYEAPTTEVVVIKMEKALMSYDSHMTSSRNSYGAANNGIEAQFDTEGNWIWE